MYRWRTILAAATSFAGLAALAAGTPADPPAGRQPLLTGGAAQPSLIISGTPVRSLHPGAVRRIEVTVTNPYRFPIQVHSIQGELTATSRRGCRPTATNLEVRAYHGTLPLRVPAGARRSDGYLEVNMPNSVADACQKADFTIRLTGRATKAER